MKNNYLYQGNYAEYDEDIGWHDFALRSYDAQIGRFWQPDPYDEFASGYTGMGNDPVNMVDPSGGFSLAGITGSSNLLFNTAVTTIGGALIGGIVGMATGDDKGWLKGAAIGAAVGLGSGINFSGGSSALSIASMGVHAASFAVNAINANATNQYAQYASYNSVNGANQVNEGIVRADGSRIFTNENEAYRYMFKQSISNNYREVMAVGLENSVLVLPDSKNTPSESTPENYGYGWKDGNLYDPVSNKYLPIKFTIHTHLNPDPYYYSQPLGSDQYYFAKNTPNKPYFTMGKDGMVHGFKGNWPKEKDGSRRFSKVKTFILNVGLTVKQILKNMSLRNIK